MDHASHHENVQVAFNIMEEWIARLRIVERYLLDSQDRQLRVPTKRERQMPKIVTLVLLEMRRAYEEDITEGGE